MLENYTLSASSAIIFIAFTLKTSLLFHTIYVSYSHSHSDPMYGIWDTQTETLTLGKYKLNTIGIENSFGHTHISLLTTDKGAMAANLWTQQRIKNHVKLYLPESNNQEINLELSSKNDLSLSFIHTGKPIIYHYHRRYIRFKDNPLRLTDEYLDTMPEF